MKRVLIGLLGCFVAQILLENWLDVPVFAYLSLRYERPGLHWLWQVFSHVLVTPMQGNAALMQLVSLLFFWWVLAPLEARFSHRFLLRLVLLTALAESAAAMLVGLFFFRGDPPLFGLGAITLAGIAAFARTLNPSAKVALFGAFSMTPKQLLALVVGISVLFFLLSKNLVSLASDLAAIAVGYHIFWLSGLLGRAPRPSGARKDGRSRNGLRVVVGGAQDDERPKWLN